MFNNQVIAGSSGQGGGFYDFPIEQSLRFNDNDTAYLSRTNGSSPTDNKKGTLSVWLKRGHIGDRQYIIETGTGASNDTYFNLHLSTANQLNCGMYSVSPFATSQVFRDVSAWYHLVFAFDSAQAVASDRRKLYINGVQVTDFASNTDIPLNTNWAILNSGQVVNIGRHTSVNDTWDGYMAEFNLIDGQALDATSFGELKSGIWIPKDTSGLTFGTNGFRLQFGDTTEASGFNTVTYTGNGSSQSINGVGFEPDFVWIKNRSAAYSHQLVDVVRGKIGSDSSFARLATNLTNAEATPSGDDGLISFDSDGFTVLGDESYNNSGQSIVAWCWDAGSGSPASNTDGSITSTVKANTDYGFSIVSYTGTGANATVGHGLGVAPQLYIVKYRNAAGDWKVYSEDVGNTYQGFLNDTLAFANTGASIWNNTSPTSSVFSIGTNAGVNTNGGNYIAYCFAEKTGYSKIGTYTGTGAAGNSITLGFKPAFLLIKETGNTNSWELFDNTRNTSSPFDKRLFPNDPQAEATTTSLSYSDTGFETLNGNTGINRSGGNYIYLAFADTRNAAFWRDTSGQGNDWQPNNLVFSDVVPDGTNNWCVIRTMNDPEESGVARAEGNLKYTTGSGTSARNTNKIGISNILPSTGKWYAEVRIHNTVTSFVGVGTLQGLLSPTSNNTRYAYLYSTDGNSYVRTGASESISTHGAAVSVGDVVGIYVDMDAATPELYFSKNGQWANGSGSFNQSTPTSAITLGDTFFTADTSNENQLAFHCCSAASGTSAQFIWNFGQDSAFAGNEAAGGNVDANGIGDFFSTVPDGALALCTANLPSGAIDTLADETPEDYFGTILYTAATSDGTYTHGDLTFRPDFTWIKNRDSTERHFLIDVVRGNTSITDKFLVSNSTAAEGANGVSGTIFSVTDTGYEFVESSINTGELYFNGRTYVGWNWKAGGSGVSNTDGSITSTVSVGATSQQNWFSIVKYTGSGGSDDYGHGLGIAPNMIITKDMTDPANWAVYVSDIGTGKYLQLNLTASTVTNSAIYPSVSSTTIGVGVQGDGSITNTSGDNYISYCFANAEGLCKVGSYVGNGSTDGPMIWTGHRPAWVMIKNTNVSSHHWSIYDNKRGPYNAIDPFIYANESSAEQNTGDQIDFLSNGFKARKNDWNLNTNGVTYIYLAIAEQPFKYANAR